MIYILLQCGKACILRENVGKAKSDNKQAFWPSGS
jgi:hypothetical protein